MPAVPLLPSMSPDLLPPTDAAASAHMPPAFEPAGRLWDPESDINDSGCLHFLVLSPGYPDRWVALAAPFPRDTAQALAALGDLAPPGGCPGPSTLMPAASQPSWTYFVVVQVPAWVPASSFTTVVFDMSACHGPCYAVTVRRMVTYKDLEDAGELHLTSGWAVFACGDRDPMRQGDFVDAAPGGVFRFVPCDWSDPWALSIEEALKDPGDWVRLSLPCDPASPDAPQPTHWLSLRSCGEQLVPHGPELDDHLRDVLAVRLRRLAHLYLEPGPYPLQHFVRRLQLRGALPPASSVGDEPSSLARSAVVGDTGAAPVEVPGLVSAWFLLLTPGRAPETIQIEVNCPAELFHVGQQLSRARHERMAMLYEHLVPAQPQPSQEFGCILTLPAWAMDQTCVLVDARDWDNRLFCLVVDAQMSWLSFLRWADLPADADFCLCVRAEPVTPGSALRFVQGDTITVVPAGAGPVPRYDLRDTVRSVTTWGPSCPAWPGPSPLAFLVLHDGGQCICDIDRHAIRNADDFRNVIADRLRYQVHRTVLKPCAPGDRAVAVLGQHCKALLVASEQFHSVPVPPGRLRRPQYTIFLDLRPILKGLHWRIAETSMLPLLELEAEFRDGLPDGFQVVVHGGFPESHDGRTFLRVQDREVLTVEYCKDPITATESCPSSVSDPVGDDEVPEAGLPDHSCTAIASSALPATPAG
ncbi:unnamed protein product [Symbiodinium sp. CCMP2592]|nr:unnamed protein product [Symbiodinium sp. CCMP2592]